MTLDFVLAAGVMVVGVAGLLLAALWRGRAQAAEPAAAVDMRVYRDQLREIERDTARGIIPASEAESLRAEIARRLLEADRALTASGALTAGGAMAQEAGQTAGREPGKLVLAAAIVLVVSLGAGGLYTQIGAPGYGDLSLRDRLEAAQMRATDRPSQAEAEAEAARANLQPPTETPDPRHAELMQQLRDTLAQRPDDLTGWRLLMRNEAGLGNVGAAAQAQAQVVRLLGPQVQPDDLIVQIELMLAAAAGYLSPEAEAVLNRLLALDPRNAPARYYDGLMQMQIGRYDLAFARWDRLLREGPPEAPWIAPIRAQIEDLAYLAGQHRYELPPATPVAAPGADPGAAPMRGPSAEDVAAAAEMSAEDRNAMIRNMVAGLAGRLATEGGPASDWARLIGAYGVLGEVENARTITTEALGVFADRPEDVQMIRDAARRAGVTP